MSHSRGQQVPDAGTLELSGPGPLVLVGAPQLLVVESGSVALFRVDLRAGEPAGPRHFLRRLGAGQPLLCNPLADVEGAGLLALAVQHAVLRERPLAAVWGDRALRSAELAGLVDEWISHLTQALPAAPPLERPARPATGGVVDLEDGQDLTPGRERVLWVRPLQGRLELLGDVQQALEVGVRPMPIGPGLWVRARGEARVEVTTTADQEQVEGLVAGLDRLERLVLGLLRLEDEREAGRELERLERRSRLQEQRMSGAMQDMAAVLHPPPEQPAAEEPLLSAVRAIGRALGVQVRGPAHPEDPERRVDPLAAITRASHLRTRHVRLTGRWWHRDCGPLLAVEQVGDQQHPIALLPRGQGYEAFDPARGRRRRVDGRLAASLAPEAITFSRPLPGGVLAVRDLATFAARGRGRDLALVLGVGIAATLLGMLVPIGTARIMDGAIPDADRRLLLEIGLGLGAAILGQTLYRLSEGVVLLRVGVTSEAQTQAALWDRLLRLRPSFFRRFSSGDLQSRVMAVEDMGRDVTGNVLTTLFSSFLSLLNLGLLWYYSASLSVLAMGIALVLVASTTAFGFGLRKYLRRFLELDGRFFGLEVQLIQGVGKLRVAGAEARAFTHWLSTYTRQLRLLARTLWLSDASRVFNVLVWPLSMMLLFVSALSLLRSGPGPDGGPALTLGTYLAFSAAFGTFLGGITSLSDTVVGFLDTLAKARRIEPILGELPEVDENKADPGRLSGQVALEGIHFRYRSDGPQVLHDLSLRAEPGEFVAVVGPSGSGKSTLLRLLLGFETPSAGKVLYDGQDLSTLDVLAVRRQLGVVLQNGRLMAGSIFENIGSGGLITLDEAWAAAEDAGFADDVREMGMQMHTIVSEGGTNLSGGQRQRLLIARALATRPRLLFLDEATSALDNRTQAVVSESLQRLLVTRIVIAHRLSTIRQANRIYVLDAGRVVEQGSFEELMRAGGLFARMMTRQLA